MGGLSFLIPRLAVVGAAVQRGANKRSEKEDLMDHLSRDLNRVRDKRAALAIKRDAIASDVTTLTTHIAELEARIAEERARCERDRVGGAIEEIKKRLEETATGFAPAIARLCDATEAATVLVPEARELNGFLSSVAAEVDTVIASLLRELRRQMEAVNEGHAAPDLAASVNEAPQQSAQHSSVTSLSAHLQPE